MRVDVVVIGAGFAGSLAATVLSRLGKEVLLIERGAHPRFAIGESSTPLADAILRRVCRRHALDELEPLCAYGTWRERRPDVMRGLKRGFTYFWHDAGARHRPSPNHRHELAVAASSADEVADTHWLRADVDHFFARVAVDRGVAYWDRATAEVVDRPPGVWRFRVSQAERAVDVEAPFVVDASGPRAAIPRALGVADATSRMETFSSALYGHFDDLPRWRETLGRDGAALGDYPFDPDAAAVHHVFPGGWMWQLRFDSERVSAGFAWAPWAKACPAGLSESEEFAWRCAQAPSLAEQFAGARCVAPRTIPFRAGRLQRRLAEASGGGWVALPFTAGFVDPLHSTGIAHALSSVERLGRLFEKGRWPTDDETRDFGKRTLTELDHIDRLVAACYAGTFDFEAFAWCCRFYFAASTWAETRDADPPDDRGFLGALDADFASATAEALSFARRLATSKGEIAPFRDWVRGRLAPYDRVGLFEAPCPNMFACTATKT